nr:stromal cell-derived factor 2-like [Dermacentor andersoni]
MANSSCWGLLLLAGALCVLVVDVQGQVHYRYVTCGSLVKLLNRRWDVRLHSHEVRYSGGSGQQSVTATEKPDDINSHWMVKGQSVTSCSRGEPIKCGEIVRLEHLKTRRNLHSHHFPSPLSSKQEISAHGENGQGNSGDFWRVVCKTGYWERDGDVRLKHADTEAWLSVSGKSYGQQLGGQLEVCGELAPYDESCVWRTAEGVFMKPSEGSLHIVKHTEL